MILSKWETRMIQAPLSGEGEAPKHARIEAGCLGFRRRKGRLDFAGRRCYHRDEDSPLTEGTIRQYGAAGMRRLSERYTSNWRDSEGISHAM